MSRYHADGRQAGGGLDTGKLGVTLCCPFCGEKARDITDNKPHQNLKYKCESCHRRFSAARDTVLDFTWESARGRLAPVSAAEVT